MPPDLERLLKDHPGPKQQINKKVINKGKKKEAMQAVKPLPTLVKRKEKLSRQ
jgi:hypothetical protein